MSAQATAWAWDKIIKSHSEKLVLLCLADSFDDAAGRVNAGLAQIATKTGLSQSTVRKALASLQKKGYLSPVPQCISPAGFKLRERHVVQEPAA